MLFYRDIIPYFPSDLTDIISLKILDLSNNSITDIPDDIGLISELKALKFPTKSFDGLYGFELSYKKPGLISILLYEYIRNKHYKKSGSGRAKQLLIFRLV